MKYGCLRLAQSADTAPTEDEILALVSVADMKAELRIRHSEEDTRIRSAILEAYSWLDAKGWMNRAILTQTWKAYAPYWDSPIELPLPFLQEVQGVQYRRESDGAWTSLEDESPGSSIYGVNTDGDNGFGEIYLKKDQDWPDLYDEEPNPIRITFTCGYGDATAVKQKARGIVKAVKLLAAHFYQNASATYTENRLVEVPRMVQIGLRSVAGMYRIANDHS